MSPLISLILPTRERPESLATFLDSLRLQTANPDRIEVVIVADEDDTASCEYRHPSLNTKTVIVPRGQTMGRLTSAGIAAACADYIFMVNDDLVVETPHWDNLVIEALQEFPDQIVLLHVNEGIFGERLCTFPFFSRKLCDLAAPLYPEEYQRYRIDDHIHNIFDLLTLLGHRRRIYLPDVIFRHHNFDVKAGEAVYVPNPEAHDHDTRLFDSQLEIRKEVALRVKAHIDAHFRKEELQLAAGRLAAVTDSVAIRDPQYHRPYPFHVFAKAAPPRTTVAVVSADLRSDYARECVDRIKTYTTNYDLVLLDNNRGPGFNHSREMNRLIELCRTDFLALLDDDALVNEGWMEGMLRAMKPGVGVVTPVHTNRAGELTYAGVVLHPDESGHHSHVLSIGAEPEPIQTLCSAAMLINMSACGHLRVDESYSKYFMDIDFGLRIWEVGHQAVCTPEAKVIHLAGATLTQGSTPAAELYEKQRQRWTQSWAVTGRLRALRAHVWPRVPTLARIEQLSQQVLALFEPGDTSLDEFLAEAREVESRIRAYPALRQYWDLRVAAELAGRLPRADEPGLLRYTVLAGLGSLPVFCGSRGKMNIVLCGGRLHAIPGNEGAFDMARFRERGYSQQAEGESLAALYQSLDAPPSPAAETPFPARPIAQAQSPSLSTRVIWAARRALAGRSPLLAELQGRHAALFSRDHYLEGNPDIARAGVDPLTHYVVQGWREHRNPHPLFHSRFYLQQHSLDSNVNPLYHYITEGAAADLAPNPLFDAKYYRRTYSLSADEHPFLHFLAHPANSPNPWFDSEWYLRHHRLDASVDHPLEHYFRFGALLALAPHPGFDAVSYVKAHPELAPSGENPLVHFLRAAPKHRDSAAVTA
jgi:GT2 family glycosyltransferase